MPITNMDQDTKTFWRKHDEALEQHKELGDPQLTHNLYRGMPDWFNSFFDYFQGRAVNKLFSKTKLPDYASSLDIGCGTGRWTAHMLNWKLNPVGIDLGFRAVQQASKQLPRAKFVCGILEAQPFRPSVFDLIISVTVLQHIPHRHQQNVVFKLHEILKPGGYILLLESIDSKDRSNHVFSNSRERWIELCKNAGFIYVGDAGCEYLPIIKTFQVFANVLRQFQRKEDQYLSVSSVAESIQDNFIMATFLKGLIKLAYPFEYAYSRIAPKRWARLGGLLMKKSV